MQWFKKGLCLALVVCLCSCTTKISYNFLDWAIQWKIGRLVKLHDDQKQTTQAAAKAFHQWHRETQLPLYAKYLHTVETRVAKGDAFTAQDIHNMSNDMQLYMDVILAQVMPDIETLLVSLDDKQVTHLLKRLDEEREEYIEEYVDLSEAKKLDKRQETFTKYSGKLIGKLTKKQRAWLKEWAKSLQPYETLNAQQQVIWQQTIADMLANRKKEGSMTPTLNQLMFYRTDNWEPKLQAVMDHNQALTYALVAKILNNLSEKQHTRLIHRLQDYQRDFIELSQKS